MHTDMPRISWEENGATREALWQSYAGLPAPRRVVLADDSTRADAAYRLAAEGAALLWRGDFNNARLLLQALARRVDRSQPRAGDEPPGVQAFHRYRMAQAQRARLLGSLLLPFDADYAIPLRRAPDVRTACEEAWGPAHQACVASLRELQGAIGAHEWRRKGVAVPALGDRIHPHYGVFAPMRGEYVDLVAQAPLPENCAIAFDIGTGTGVLAAVLAKRGVERVVATDCDPRALGCAGENLARLGLAARVDVVAADLFPPGRASLVVCNPPWLPGKAATPLERAIYDPEERMLRGFLRGLAAHLAPGGEGWLILSDLAERLGLRQPDALAGLFAAAGLRMLGCLEARPTHPRVGDRTDPLHAARAGEITRLWRLAV